jgi:hypothetical protein
MGRGEYPVAAVGPAICELDLISLEHVTCEGVR